MADVGGRTLTIIAKYNQRGVWIATGPNCQGRGRNPGMAINQAKGNYVDNVKSDPRWRGRVNVLKKILRQDPLSSRATWEGVTVVYSMKEKKDD